jgi:hypothetical protein
VLIARKNFDVKAYIDSIPVFLMPLIMMGSICEKGHFHLPILKHCSICPGHPWIAKFE